MNWKDVLRAAPDDALLSEYARRRRAKGKGKPAKPTACAKCGYVSPSAREARKHKCPA